MDETLMARSRTMEDAFFARQDQVLLEQMRRAEEGMSRRQALADALAIDDEAVLDALVARGLHADEAAALMLVPVIAVVWADGDVAEAERDVVLRAIETHGVISGSPAHSVVEHWLERRPDPGLLVVWKAYARTLLAALPVPVAHSLARSLLACAQSAALAAGGFLGFGRVSPDEQRVLDEVAAALGIAADPAAV